jgi:hypothetical protein
MWSSLAGGGAARIGTGYGDSVEVFLLLLPGLLKLFYNFG